MCVSAISACDWPTPRRLRALDWPRPTFNPSAPHHNSGESQLPAEDWHGYTLDILMTAVQQKKLSCSRARIFCAESITSRALLQSCLGFACIQKREATNMRGDLTKPAGNFETLCLKAGVVYTFGDSLVESTD